MNPQGVQQSLYKSHQRWWHRSRTNPRRVLRAPWRRTAIKSLCGHRFLQPFIKTWGEITTICSSNELAILWSKKYINKDKNKQNEEKKQQWSDLFLIIFYYLWLRLMEPDQTASARVEDANSLRSSSGYGDAKSKQNSWFVFSSTLHGRCPTTSRGELTNANCKTWVCCCVGLRKHPFYFRFSIYLLFFCLEAWRSRNTVQSSASDAARQLEVSQNNSWGLFYLFIYFLV